MDLTKEPQKNKLGTFEWVVGFSEIQRFLESEFTGISTSIPKEEQRVLVLGCGTSTLSKELADRGYGEVVSIDNDAGCIKHMERTFGSDARMKWYTYDLVEHVGDDALIGRTETFDIVVDKGTLDAILVEGAVSNMLGEVHRFLRPGGVYLLCSINSEDMLNTLLRSPALGFEVSTYLSNGEQCGSGSGNGRYNLKTNPSAKSQGVVVMCKKPDDARGVIVDAEALATQEREAMDFYFNDEVPLLTPEFEASLRERFHLASSRLDTCTLPVDVAYLVMFNDTERSAYTYDLFQEDLRAFVGPGGMSRELSCTDCIEFVKQMQ